MRFLLRSFLRGLLVVVPVVTTIYILVRLFIFLDELVPWPEGFVFFRGAGVLLIFTAMVVVGSLASSALTRWAVQLVQNVFERLPLVKLIYSSLRDLIGAFVGDGKKFETPVAIRVYGDIKILGFITRRDVDHLGIEDHVAVYCPQSYNFAGQVMLVPAKDVTVLEIPSSEAMTFIVSGGVSEATPREGKTGSHPLIGQRIPPEDDAPALPS